MTRKGLPRGSRYPGNSAKYSVRRSRRVRCSMLRVSVSSYRWRAPTRFMASGVGSVPMWRLVPNCASESSVWAAAFMRLAVCMPSPGTWVSVVRGLSSTFLTVVTPMVSRPAKRSRSLVTVFRCSTGIWAISCSACFVRMALRYSVATAASLGLANWSMLSSLTRLWVGVM